MNQPSPASDSPSPQKSRLKGWLRWAILGAVLFFLGATLKEHWDQATSVRLDREDWGLVAIALLVTLLAHVWGGWVWGLILRHLHYRVGGGWASRTYLRTNIAKYVPGNVWQFVGRVKAAESVGVPLGVATLSMVMELLLMAAAALILALIGTQHLNFALQAVALGAVLAGLHPRCFDPVLHFVSRRKVQGPLKAEPASLQVRRYPVVPLLGEWGFLTLRGLGFLGIMAALLELHAHQVVPLLGAFSLSWLLGFVVPGAPGGLGVFEATAIALLQGSFPAGIILSAVTLYRLVSILAEALGALLAWLVERFSNSGCPDAVHISGDSSRKIL